MRLKSLRLFGFKSFAERTELVFPPGITAIVGPNGSGKSNLIDAIVWVLGERKVKTLRSSRASDLLFAGNGKVKPAGLAEVILTLELDEGDGDPLKGLTELVIARRLKRSGESQFFVNRIPCRLRDVQELLIELGVSPESYAIVGQAEIDQIVVLSPQERRTLLEQIAGVHRFQWHCQDALEKLERTDRNLIRLRDLSAELERQRDALETEVEKARRYQNLLDRRRVLQIALIGWEHQVRLRRLERLREEERALRQELEGLDGQISQAHRERQSVDEALAHLEGNFQRLQETVTRALEESEAIERELALSRERHHHLTHRETQLGRQLVSLAERQLRLSSEAEMTRKQIESLLREEKMAHREEKELEGRVIECRRLLAALERELQDARDERFEAERALVETTSQLSSLEPLLQALKARKAEVEREGREIQGRLAELKRKEEALRAEREGIKGLSDTLMRRLQRVKELFQEKGQEAERLRQRMGALREKLAAAKARLATLEEMEVSLKGVPEGARAVLMAVRDGKLGGEFHLLAHLLKVPEGLEVAFENALGAAANCLLTPTLGEVGTAIEFLKTHGFGRASFIALDFLTEIGGISEHKGKVEGEGVIGWASELVRVKEKRFEGAVRRILRDILIVEDLKAAYRLAPKVKGVRFVTLSGEVIDPSGTISGGVVRRGSISVFRRHQERERLTLQVQGGQREIQEMEEQLQTVEGERNRLREESDRIGAERQRLTRRYEELMVEEQRLQGERDRWGKERERLLAEAQRLKGEEEELLKEMEALKAQGERWRRRRDDAQERLRKAQEALTEMRDRYGDLMEQWQRMQTVKAERKARRETLHRRHEELKAELNELKQQRAALEGEKERVRQEIAALAQKLPELEGELEGRRRVRAEAERALVRWRSDRRQLLERREGLERQLAELKQRRDEVAQALHRCEVRKTQTEMERAEMERRLKEEFEVTPKDAHKEAATLGQKQGALDELERLKREMEAMGAVNLTVLEEHARLTERITTLREQIADLEGGREQLLATLTEMEQKFQERFREALRRADEAFDEIIHRFWGSGEGRLILLEGQTLSESGVEVKVRLPGKPERDLIALSGGEKAIVGLCFIFALLKLQPPPFVLLDEVDAALDEANTERFVQLLRDFSDQSQFIIITHNPITIQAADHLYGVTLDDRGTSKVLSLSLKEALTWAEKAPASR